MQLLNKCCSRSLKSRRRTSLLLQSGPTVRPSRAVRRISSCTAERSARAGCRRGASVRTQSRRRLFAHVLGSRDLHLSLPRRRTGTQARVPCHGCAVARAWPRLHWPYAQMPRNDDAVLFRLPGRCQSLSRPCRVGAVIDVPWRMPSRGRGRGHVMSPSPPLPPP